MEQEKPLVIDTSIQTLNEEIHIEFGGGYVITQLCIGVKDASCLEVCPVDSIHPTKNEPGFETVEKLYINRDECICCGACEPACPVSAIFVDYAVPQKQWQDIKDSDAFFNR